MKYVKKRVLLVFSLMMCVLFSTMNAFAADERLGEIVDGSLLTEESESTGTTQTVSRGAFLSYGSGTLANPSAGKASISGQTVCYSTCDKVKVTLHLQRLVGNSWVNVATLGPKTAYNTYTVSTSKSYSVTGGYYYRVSGSHVAIKNGSTETVASNSNGIWID